MEDRSSRRLRTLVTQMANMMAGSTTRSYQRPDTLDISAPAFSLVHLGHFRAWRCIGIEGSLSPDSCRVGRMQGTEALGPGCVKTRSDLVVMRCGARIFALFVLRAPTRLKNHGALLPRSVFTQPGSIPDMRHQQAQHHRFRRALSQSL